MEKVNPQSGNPESLVESSTLRVQFTLFESPRPLSKSFKIVGGEIEKTPSAQMTSGSAKRIEMDFSDFGAFLDRLTARQATGYGIHDTAQFELKAKIATAEKADPPKTIARTKQYFRYSDGPGIVMLDYDPSPNGKLVTPDELLTILGDIHPDLGTAACLIRGSVSSGVRRVGEQLAEPGRYHLYFPVTHAADIPRFGDILFKRLWLKGHGFIQLSKSGAMLERTLVDGAVFSGERLDFSGHPHIESESDELEYTLPAREYRSGDYLDTAGLPDLTESETVEFQKRVDEAKKAIEPEAAQIRNAWIDAKIPELVKSGISETDARKKLQRLAQGLTQDLPGEFVLHFANTGPVTVSEVLANPKQYDGQALADPIEGPEYGRTTAKFYANAGNRKGDPCVHSFAHGTKSKFFLKEEKSRNKNPALSTLPAFAGATDCIEQNLPCTDPALPDGKPGRFTFREENGDIKRLIESKTAELLAQDFLGRFAFNGYAREWHQFTGTHWANIAAAEPEKDIIQALHEETTPIGFTDAYSRGVTNLLTRGGKLSLPTQQPDRIPFKNGLLNVRTNQLEPIMPENALTWIIPHDYVKGTDCCKFKGWLRQALSDDAELVELLRAFINACLTGRADLQKFLVLLGPGGTGKSTFLRLLYGILGESNYVATDLKNLENNRFEAAMLYNKRLAAITDAGHYTGKVDILKAITGEDPVRLEKKYVQQAGTFRFYGMVIIATNEPLGATDYTSGLDRRRVVVEFKHRFNGDDTIQFGSQGGENALHEEIPSIINWALELSREEVSRIFAELPKACLESTREALFAQNPIADWIDQNLEAKQGHWVQIGVKRESKRISGGTVFEDAETKLYPNYLTWCKENGCEPVKLQRFRRICMDMLQSLGFSVIESRRGPGQGISGIRIRSESEKCRIISTEVQYGCSKNSIQINGCGGSAGSATKFLYKKPTNLNLDGEIDDGRL